jgi:hypothetical protein
LSLVVEFKEDLNRQMIFPKTSQASPTLEERNYVLSSRLGAPKTPNFVFNKKNQE